MPFEHLEKVIVITNNSRDRKMLKPNMRIQLSHKIHEKILI